MNFFAYLIICTITQHCLFLLKHCVKRAHFVLKSPFHFKLKPVNLMHFYSRSNSFKLKCTKAEWEAFNPAVSFSLPKISLLPCKRTRNDRSFFRRGQANKCHISNPMFLKVYLIVPYSTHRISRWLFCATSHGTVVSFVCEAS